VTPSHGSSRPISCDKRLRGNAGPFTLGMKSNVFRPGSSSPPSRLIKLQKPPSGPDWVHEIKHDAYRLIVRQDGSPQFGFYTRNAYDWTARLSVIAGRGRRRMKAKSFTIDGEAGGGVLASALLGMNISPQATHGMRNYDVAYTRGSRDEFGAGVKAAHLDRSIQLPRKCAKDAHPKPRCGAKLESVGSPPAFVAYRKFDCVIGATRDANPDGSTLIILIRVF